MNTLIIVADTQRARLFRLAHRAGSREPLELIEIDSIQNASEAHAALDFPVRVAEHAATFARYHVCNPVIVTAPLATSRTLLRELERQLPETYILPLACDLSAVEPSELLPSLQRSLIRPEPGHLPAV